VCVPTVDGLTYYGKLMDIIKVEYYDKTNYVMFKCDWADTTRDRGYKLDEYGMIVVNFNCLVHRGDQETDDLCMLTSQVDQVFYIKDERNPGWACAVQTNPGASTTLLKVMPHDACDNYHECEPFLLTRINDNDPSDHFDHVRSDSDLILA
jgi:hypothetical protein